MHLLLNHSLKTQTNTMKKLLALAAVCCFLLASCCNCNKNAAPAECPDSTKTECASKADKKPCCKEMTEEQKAECEAWKNFDSLTAEEQENLVNKRKAAIDQKRAEKEAKEKEIAEKKAAFEAKWANWDQLTTAEKKALLDEMSQCHRKCNKPCKNTKCHHGDKECKKEGCDKPCKK